MKLIITVLSFYSLGICLALYPAANYKSVVTKPPPKLFAEYAVPLEAEELYGLPHVKVPSVIYGVPTKTFDFDLTDIIDSTDEEEVHEEPPEAYGVPAVPSTSYGVPVKTALQKAGNNLDHKPQVPSTSYGEPSAIKVDFNDNSLVQKLPEPLTSYGVPVKPSEIYGVPEKTNVVSKVFDQKLPIPSSAYGVPLSIKVGVPSTSYGVPVESDVISKSFESYELPKVKVLSVEYGVPEKLNQEYGLPKVRIPASVYGLA